jgi:DNA-binding transcriptional MocR family regulator
MNLLGWLRAGADDRQLAKQLAEEGFDIPSLSSYSLKARTPGLVFGFTAFTPRQIRTSVEQVSRILEKTSGHRHRTS